MESALMRNVTHKPEQISGLETWAFALATALVALIVIGVLPALVRGI
jgi:hypothetical protein